MSCMCFLKIFWNVFDCEANNSFDTAALQLYSKWTAVCGDL